MPLNDRWQTALWPQRRGLYRPHLEPRCEAERKVSHQRGHGDQGLLCSEARADAGSQAGTKWQIGKAIDLFTRAAQKSAGSSPYFERIRSE